MEEERLQGIGLWLVQQQIVTKEVVWHHQKMASAKQHGLLYHLVLHDVLNAKTIADTLAHDFGLPRFNLDNLSLDTLLFSTKNDTFLNHHHVLPLNYQEQQWQLATDDPYESSSLQNIQFHNGRQPQLFIVETDKLHHILTTLRHQKNTKALSQYYATASSAITIDNTAIEEAPIVSFINNILLDAVEKGASDIHFEPYENDYRIRFRNDGLLTLKDTPPIALASRIAARLKVMSHLDIAEKRLPQDGRFQITFREKKTVDFRISTCPTAFGEKVVIRLLHPEGVVNNIKSLGLTPWQHDCFLTALNHPQGMIVVTGPTGSGKTVTLYTALAQLNTIERNISTAEDPIEIKLPGINQVTVQPQNGLTFAKLLRSFLRQDPDVIMVGEIRDEETADMAMKAAQTGHLVLTTLHTNSAAETLIRLMDMGIPAFLVAHSVSLIVAQRLIRRLCDHCKVEDKDISEEQKNTWDIAATEKLYQAKGCEHCHDGYCGRIGIFEVMPMSHELRRLLLSEKSANDLLIQAQQDGMKTIHQHALEKVKAGLTSRKEIYRVTVSCQKK